MNTASPSSPLSPATRTFRVSGAELNRSEVSYTDPSSTPRWALVLHGGGSAGNAWEIGVIAGLLDAGVDLTRADLVIGTSAGATAAAQVTSASPRELLSAIVDAPSQQAAPRSPYGGRIPGPAIDHMERTNRIISSAESPADMRRRMGAAALQLDAGSDGSVQQRWRDTVAGRLPSHQWPKQEILITAVDALTGEPVVFDRRSGIHLVDAVAASTSNGFGVPPYWIGRDRFIDGGYRRNENADLAVGHERVVVLSPFGGRSRHPAEWGMQLAVQVEELRASGSAVESIFPGEVARQAFGSNMMDPASRRPSASAGYEQAMADAERVAKLCE